MNKTNKARKIIRKKDILTRALSEARKLNKSIIWE